MTVGIAADHDGFEMKQELAKILADQCHEIVDFGAKICDPSDDYPDFAIPLGRAVSRGDVERGILLCGSAVGASVAANKLGGVRAPIYHDHVSARHGVEDDDINVLCLGSATTGATVACDCLKDFLNAKFIGPDRHRRRLAKVAQLEAAWMPIIIGSREDR